MIKANNNVRVKYGGTVITEYLNEFELATTIAEIETTHLASTTQTYIPSMTEYSLSLSGDWRSAFDTIFGPDAITPTLRTVVISFSDGSGSAGSVAIYTWTTNAFITGYNISASSGDKITHSATLRLSGPPSRTTDTALPA